MSQIVGISTVMPPKELCFITEKFTQNNWQTIKNVFMNGIAPEGEKHKKKGLFGKLEK